MKIQEGKYYKTISETVVKATSSSNGADSFRAIPITDPHNLFILNKEYVGWDPTCFEECDYKENVTKQYSKFLLLCAK